MKSDNFDKQKIKHLLKNQIVCKYKQKSFKLVAGN